MRLSKEYRIGGVLVQVAVQFPEAKVTAKYRTTAGVWCRVDFTTEHMKLKADANEVIKACKREARFFFDPQKDYHKVVEPSY
jgi:hypothetical protein